MNPELAAGVGVIMVFIRKQPCTHEPLKIRDSIFAQQIIAITARLFSLITLKDRAPLRERSNQTRLPHTFILFARQ